MTVSDYRELRPLPAWVEEDFPLVQSIRNGQAGLLHTCGHDHALSPLPLLFPRAVAFSTPDHPTFGTICFIGRHVNLWSFEEPSRLFLHEYAHLEAQTPRHPPRFWSTFERLLSVHGQPPLRDCERFDDGGRPTC